MALQIDSLRPVLHRATAVQQQTAIWNAEGDTPECLAKLQDLLGYGSGLKRDNKIKETYRMYRHPDPQQIAADIPSTVEVTQSSMKSRHICEKQGKGPFTEIRFLDIEGKLKLGDIERLEVALRLVT